MSTGEQVKTIIGVLAATSPIWVVWLSDRDVRGTMRSLLSSGEQVRDNGDRVWLHHGRRHRIDGPAVITHDGHRYYYQRDRLHRTDGPAYESPYGDREWWLNGRRVEVNGPVDEAAFMLGLLDSGGRK